MSRVCGGSSVWVLSFEQLRSQHNFTVVRNVFIIGVASTCWSQRLVNVCCSSVDEILVACRYDSVVVTTKRYLNDYAWSWSRWTMRWWGHRCFNSKKSRLAWWDLRISYVRYFSTNRLADPVFFIPSNLIPIFINKGNWMYESFVHQFNRLFRNLFHMR